MTSHRVFTFVVSLALPFLLLVVVSVGAGKESNVHQQQLTTEAMSEPKFIAAVDSLKMLSDALRSSDGKSFREALKLLEPKEKKGRWKRIWRKLTSIFRRNKCRKSLKRPKCKQDATIKLAEHTKRLEEVGEKLVQEAGGNASQALLNGMEKLRRVKTGESTLKNIMDVGKRVFNVGKGKLQSSWGRLKAWADDDGGSSSSAQPQSAQPSRQPSDALFRTQRPHFAYPLDALSPRYPAEQRNVERAVQLLNANTATGAPIQPKEGEDLTYELHSIAALTARTYLNNNALAEFISSVEEELSLTVGEQLVQREDQQRIHHYRQDGELLAVLELIPIRVRGFVRMEWGSVLGDLSTSAGYMSRMHNSYDEVSGCEAGIVVIGD